MKVFVTRKGNIHPYGVTRHGVRRFGTGVSMTRTQFQQIGDPIMTERTFTLEGTMYTVQTMPAARFRDSRTNRYRVVRRKDKIMTRKASERIVVQVTPAEKRAILDYCARHGLQVSAHTRKLWSDAIEDYPDVRYSQGQTVERDS